MLASREAKFVTLTCRFHSLYIGHRAAGPILVCDREAVAETSIPRVCFSISICDPFVTGEKACNYGMKYRSIVGYGKIGIVASEEERKNGLNLIMKKYTGKDQWDYDEEMLGKTTVTCLEVETLTGKRKK
jgi:nitroimidazol reductase NimA-like FMN-containing flavoprotein (pyridoxamine 5'-phosphate oxidase superfamily)